MCKTPSAEDISYIYHSGKNGSIPNGPKCSTCMNAIFLKGGLNDVTDVFVHTTSGLLPISIRWLWVPVLMNCVQCCVNNSSDFSSKKYPAKRTSSDAGLAAQGVFESSRKRFSHTEEVQAKRWKTECGANINAGHFNKTNPGGDNKLVPSHTAVASLEKKCAFPKDSDDDEPPRRFLNLDPIFSNDLRENEHLSTRNAPRHFQQSVTAELPEHQSIKILQNINNDRIGKITITKAGRRGRQTCVDDRPLSNKLARKIHQEESEREDGEITDSDLGEINSGPEEKLTAKAENVSARNAALLDLRMSPPKQFRQPPKDLGPEVSYPNGRPVLNKRREQKSPKKRDRESPQIPRNLPVKRLNSTLINSSSRTGTKKSRIASPSEVAQNISDSNSEKPSKRARSSRSRCNSESDSRSGPPAQPAYRDISPDCPSKNKRSKLNASSPRPPAEELIASSTLSSLATF